MLAVAGVRLSKTCMKEGPVIFQVGKRAFAKHTAPRRELISQRVEKFIDGLIKWEHDY